MTRPSDVNEGINQALEVASPESSTTQTGKSGTDTTASVEVPEEDRGVSDPNQCTFAVVAEETGEIVGVPGAEVTTFGPENLPKFAGERADAAVDGLTIQQPVVIPEQPQTAMTSPAIPLESLAKYSDEGENGWNAQGRSDIARKMHRIAAGGYNSIEKLIRKVEELAEVGQ